MERWIGKVAVVTGASSGIGEAIVRDLVTQGLKVAALARRVDRLKKLESDLAGCKGEIKGIECDVTKEDSVVKAFQEVHDTWGQLNVLVNNAGVLRNGPSFVLKHEDYKSMFDTNVIGVASCTREGMKQMVGKSTEGHVININSVAGRRVLGIGGFGAYSASKHSVSVMSESLRQELAMMDENIRVTNISPGLVESEMSQQLTKGLGGDVEIPILPASAISQSVMYALSAPAIVNVSEITIQPTREKPVSAIMEKLKQK